MHNTRDSRITNPQLLSFVQDPQSITTGNPSHLREKSFLLTQNRLTILRHLHSYYLARHTRFHPVDSDSSTYPFVRRSQSQAGTHRKLDIYLTSLPTLLPHHQSARGNRSTSLTQSYVAVTSANV